jgi:signal transduction histidine kinase
VPGNSTQGSGLGLAIVKHIAERHRAAVTYRLREPHGLCVQVRFPPMTASALT